MSTEESPDKFVVFVNGHPREFRDSREDADELLRRYKQAKGDVKEAKEIADHELTCPGCHKKKLVFAHYAGGGGWMSCPKCGRVGTL